MPVRAAIVMGSDSDLPVMSEAAAALDLFGVPYDITIVSAHRTPERLYEFARSAAARYGVVVAGAGGAAHLPGMVAAMTAIPVIGVPIQTRALSGLDSLLSIVQMPAGIPVAAVAIGGGKNAGLLAAKILAVADGGLAAKIAEYSESLRDETLKKAERLEDVGYKNYQNI
ncbi:MAG: 5-(carboxyamino)imidazole ribonucleotide mutase [Clostridiales bacterium]|jgi:5-(carboxyamino)imidazole ribonucleotide mutase|nr:5-(carboxyamino)imidazole ribonucleotide mutase [Clostridiales bacterium]